MSHYGTLSDPIFNPIGKEYGFLIENGTGHHFLYLKDVHTQYYPHGTPVTFNTIYRTVSVDTVNKGSHDFALELAIITGFDEEHIPENGFAPALIPGITETEWSGKTHLDFELPTNEQSAK